jgi:hypothetical protein
LWIWAAVTAAMAIFTWFNLGSTYPLASLPWAVAALLLLTHQPLALALTAVLWSLSLVYLVPGLDLVFGPDPISNLLAGSAVEAFGRALLRIVMAITAWNQFMFYRLLYGTVRASGLPYDSPPIPEVVPNRSDAGSIASAATGVVALLSALSATAPFAGAISLRLVQLGFALSLLSLGLGLGSAFSPTDRRRQAMAGSSLAVIAFLVALAVGRVVFVSS